MALPDYQDESKIIPQGLLEELQKWAENGNPLPKNLQDKIVEILGENWRNASLPSVIDAIENLEKLRSKDELKSIDPKTLEYLLKQYNERPQEIENYVRENFGEQGVKDLIRQQTFLREQNLKNLNIPEEKTTNQIEQTKYQKPTEPAKTSFESARPQEVQINKTTETPKEQVVENEAAKEFFRIIDELGTKSKEAKEKREKTNLEAKQLADTLSQGLTTKLEKENQLIISSDDKKIIGEKIFEKILTQDIYGNFTEEIIEGVVQKNKEIQIDEKKIARGLEINDQPTARARDFIEKHKDGLTEIQEAILTDQFISFYKKNADDFTPKDIPLIKEHLAIVKDLTKISDIGGHKAEIIKNNPNISPGELQKRINELEIFFNAANKANEKKLAKLMEQYGINREKLRGIIPFTNSRLISLDNFHRLYSQSQEFQSFIRQIGSIRSKNIGIFLQNNFRFFGNSFSQSFFSGLRGTLKTGNNLLGIKTKGLLSSLKIGGKRAASALKIGAKGIASGLKIGGGPVGWALLAADLIKSAFTKPEEFAKIFIGVFLAVIIGIPLTGCALTSTITGSFAPITEWQELIQDLDVESSISCEDKAGYIEPTKSYQSDTSERFIFWVFEPGSRGGRLTQKYDLEESAPLFSQERISPQYNAGTQNSKLDSRVIPAYQAMIEAGRASGQLSYPDKDLKMTSGYRNKAYQEKLWNEALIKYGSPEAAKKYVAPPGCSPHQTGRAIDIYVNGSAGDPSVYNQQRLSKTFQWLSENASKYGFYNYINEPWHWEYNPIDK